MSRRALATAALSIAALVLPAGARADVNRLYNEYRALGTVPGCAHSEAELRDGLAQIPADVRAYDPGFADALNSALEQRAASCEGGASAQGNSGKGRLAADGSPGPAASDVGAGAGAGAGGAAEADDGTRQALLLGVAGVAAAVAAFLAAGRRRRD